MRLTHRGRTTSVLLETSLMWPRCLHGLAGLGITAKLLLVGHRRQLLTSPFTHRLSLVIGCKRTWSDQQRGEKEDSAARTVNLPILTTRDVNGAHDVVPFSDPVGITSIFKWRPACYKSDAGSAITGNPRDLPHCGSANSRGVLADHHGRVGMCREAANCGSGRRGAGPAVVRRQPVENALANRA